MKKRNEEHIESNNSIEELSNGFVPVQYKIIKLDAKYIVKCGKKEVKKEKGTGVIEFYDVPEIQLTDWLLMTRKDIGNSGLVSVGDNILFQKIREVKAAMNGNPDMGGLTPNQQQKEAVDKLNEYNAEIKQLKRLVLNTATPKKRAELTKKLNKKIKDREEFLFIPDLINVQSKSKTDYDKFGEKGFFYAGEKYVRRSAGSGNLKQNTVTFIREKLVSALLPKLRVEFQIDIETTDILLPSKFGAYEGLTTSGCIFVTKPNVVVIPDFKYITFKDKNNKEHMVEFVTKDTTDPDNPEYSTKKIPFYETDPEGAYLNSFDGMGMVSPDFIETVWAKDLGIDYIPSAFNVRSIGVKGLLVTFPFKEFARRNGFESIIDIKYKDCDEENVRYTPLFDDDNPVDVILTESQWKYMKLYADIRGKLGYNFDYYNKNPEAIWGVQRYAPKVDKDVSRLNYQLVQTSNVRKDEDIQRVVDPTEKYLRLLAEGDYENIMYALLKEVKLFKEQDVEIDEIEDEELEDDEEEQKDEGTIDYEELRTTTLNKAIYKNFKLLDDAYVNTQIKKMILGILDKAKCGKLYPEHNSNYQFMISDPYGLAQWAFNWYNWQRYGTQGVEDRVIERIPKTPKEKMLSGIGLVPANHVYSKYWLDRNVSRIGACRSPMTDTSEHNILDVCNKDNISSDVFSEMETYYTHLKSGIIYSLHDLSTVRHADSDFDSDVVCTFDSEVFIENAWGTLPVTYQKGLNDAGNTPKKYTLDVAVQSDKDGFGNKVGVYSNKSTSIFSMLPMYEEETEDNPKHNNPDYVEYDCTEKGLALHLVAKKGRMLVGEEVDATKNGVHPKLSSDFKYAFAKNSMSEIRRYNQTEIESFVKKHLKKNALVPYFMPYFFIYAKPDYRDKYTKYKMKLNDTCKWYTFESIDNFVGAVMRGERVIETKEEQEFWDYFSENCPLLLTDCLMNKICWKLEIFEQEIERIFKEKWTDKDKYILMGYAKDVELTKNQQKIIKQKYEEYKSEIKFIYGKKNIKATNDLFQIGRREALLFKLRTELCTELNVEPTELFHMLVTGLKKEKKSNYGSINAFIWNIMGDDILDVIPANEKYLIWNDSLKPEEEFDIEILGKKVKFTWKERKFD